MEKTVKYAKSVIETLKQECADGVIKDIEIPLLCNIKTGKNTGLLLYCMFHLNMIIQKSYLVSGRRGLVLTSIVYPQGEIN